MSIIKKLKNREKDIIDSFYEEKEPVQFMSEEEIQFEEKLRHSLVKMDLVKEISPEMDLNILSIINTGTEIVERKKSLKEFLAFILVTLVILSCFAALTIIIGQKFLMYTEGIIFVAIPIVLIPLAKGSLRRGDI